MRSRELDQEEIDRVARSIWVDTRTLMGDYHDVPFDKLLTRHRYQSILSALRRTAENVIDTVVAL